MENSYHITPLNISVDLGREEIYELGRKAPYHRFIDSNRLFSEVLWELDISKDNIHYHCKCVEVIINV